MSSITLAELEFGIEKNEQRARNRERLHGLLAGLPVLAFDVAAAQSYGVVRLALEKKGTPIGPNDTLIAAHALAIKATLVTSNVSEFQRVSELTVENWALA